MAKKIIEVKPTSTETEFNDINLESGLINGEMMIRVRVTGGKVLTRVATKDFPKSDIAIAAKDIEAALAVLYAE